MTLQLDLYWSFRSPYSYLITKRVLELEQNFDVKVNPRIVYPLAVRSPDHFERVHPLWWKYLLLDTARVATMLGLPFAWPEPDPIVVEPDTGKFSAHQPYIFRLCHLGVEATRRGQGMKFIDQVSYLIWSGQTRGWNEGDHLSAAIRRSGLVLGELDAAIASPNADHAAEIHANQQALESVGHWGVPTIVAKNEPFFGQDRFDLCLWRLKEYGLERRST